MLQPKRMQAEYFDSVSRGHTAHFQVRDEAGSEGGKYLGGTNRGGYFTFEPINLSNITSVQVRYANNGWETPSAPIGQLELRADAADGTLLATIDGKVTGGDGGLTASSNV